MKLVSSLAAAAAAVLVSITAQAQLSEEESKAAARAAYLEGVQLQESGKPAEALARFEAAQGLFDAPTHLLRIAECQALTGRLVEAAETYETLIRRPLGDTPPQAFVDAQEQGRAEVGALRARIPTLRVTVKPEARELSGLRIFVNDREIPPELVGIARPVNPGSYRLRAVATGWTTATPVDVDVQERQAKSIELVLEPGGGAHESAPAAGLPPVYDEITPRAAPRPSAKEPSTAGLLFGARPTLLATSGHVSDKRRFDDIAEGGVGLGFDLLGRVAKRFLVGGTLEYAALGAERSPGLSADWRSDVSAPTVYVGAIAGFVPNIEKLTFVGDVGLGARFLSRMERASHVDGYLLRVEETYRGLEVAASAGLAIPVGAIRIVPKVGLSAGTFGSRSCHATAHGGDEGLSAPVDWCGTSSAAHRLLHFGVGLYYHLDLAKKQGRPAVTASALGR